MAGADRRGIFVERDVAHAVEAFNSPMTAAEGLDLSGIHFRCRSATDQDFGFFGDPNRFEMMSGADDDSPEDGIGKAGLFRSDFKGINFTGFVAAMALAQSDVRRQRGAGLGELSQFSVELWLISFYGE